MNRLIKVCAVCVAAVWLFCMGLVIGSYGVRRQAKKELEPSTEPPSVTQNTQQDVQTSQIVIDMVTNQTTLPEKKDDPLGTTSSGGNITTFASMANADANEQTPQSKLPSGNAEIAKALVNAINATKATQNFTAKKTENLSVTIDQATGGIEGIVNSLVSKQLDKPDTVCTFSNGVDSSGSGKTPNALIAPINKMASLDESGVQSASVTAGTDGAYTVDITLKPEKQTLKQNAKNHSGVFETFDFSSLKLPSGISVTDLHISYSGAKITAKINKNGKLDSITYVLPMTEGGGSGKMLVPVNVTMHGQYDCTLTCTY